MKQARSAEFRVVKSVGFTVLLTLIAGCAEGFVDGENGEMSGASGAAAEGHAPANPSDTASSAATAGTSGNDPSATPNPIDDPSANPNSTDTPDGDSAAGPATPSDTPASETPPPVAEPGTPPLSETPPTSEQPPTTTPPVVSKPPVVKEPAGPIVAPADPGASDVALEIRADRDVHAISPLVYGTNGAKDLATNRQGLVRLGGNRWTAYNWENNASNAGNDYQFQNDGYLSSSNTPGAAVGPIVDQAQAAGAATLVTVPILDYVAADKNGGGDVRNSGTNYLTTRFKQNKPTKGSQLGSPDVNDGVVYQDEFVHWLKTTRPNAKILFSLDNEPDLWSSTHAEIHPQNVGYDELCERNITYAKSIKSVWPTAQVVGSVNYGWYGFVTLQDAPDRTGKGEYLDYYLARMKAAEAANGKRLVDYLDLHWYPEAQGAGVRITGANATAAVAEARVQAPRSLWDATYKETSWVANSAGGPIQLIPRVKTKIAKNYPGTALAFTEWNFGGGGHISGGIATADVLGIFGRDGVELANFWALNSDESFSYAAFRVFRNFDGKGGAFGDTSIFASTSDATSTSVYASIDSKDANRLVAVVINKGTSAKTAGLKLAHPASYSKATVYTLTSSAAALRPATNVQAVGTNAFRYDMPAQSVSVLVFTR